MKLRVVTLTALVALAPVSLAVGDSLEPARTLIADGRFEAALESLDEAAPGNGDPEALFLRGLALVGIQRVAEAEAAFRELIDQYPDRPEAYNNLAVLQAEEGRYDEAVETLKSALRTSEPHRTAWENLTTVYGKLASDAYNRALNLGSARDASGLQLVLLDTLEPAAEVVPAEPLEAEAPVVAEPLAASEPMTAEADEVDEGLAESEPASGADDAAAGPSGSELVGVVEAWAAAWSAQRPGDYLAFYAKDFEPAEMSRADWEEMRRSRLTAPEFIEVSIAVLDFELDGDEASVTFNQSYTSNTFSDLVTKKLELVREDGSWRIAGETVEP